MSSEKGATSLLALADGVIERARGPGFMPDAQYAKERQCV